MKLKDSYPVFLTGKLKETSDFYAKWFGFGIYFESSFFILMTSEGEKPFNFGFMDEDHPSSPPSTPAITGDSGVFLTFEVEDVRAEYEKFKDAGIAIYYPLTDEAWGQRRFGVTDPNGMYIDIVEQTEPEEGFWDQYM